jgi:hypothetical protein
MKHIPLTKGYVTLVDDDDFDELSKHKWCVCVVKPGRPYAYRRCPITRKNIAMHRQILKAPDGFDVDHKNRNTLDNQRSNIRIATRAQNRANTGPNQNSKTGYKGVRYVRAATKRPFIAFIRNGNYRHIGSFADPAEAARAYDAEARKLWGEFAFQNFPNFF